MAELSTDFVHQELDYLQRGGDFLGAERSRYIRLLKECGRSKSLAEGRAIHRHVLRSPLEKDLLVGSQLIRMFLDCGSLDSARVAFDGMDKRDAESWNAVIAEFAKKGHYTEALRMYQRMTEVGYVIPNDITLLTVLKILVLFPGLESLKAGRQIHASVVWRKKKKEEMDSCVAAALMNLYAKCGCLADAESLFEEMSFKDRVAWSTMIAGNARSGESCRARRLFRRMQQEGIKPNNVVFVNILGVLTRCSDLAEGRSLHSMVIQAGLHTKVILATALISMYGRCGCAEAGFEVFRNTHPKDVVVWNAMIGAYGHNGDFKSSMKVFQKLVSGKLAPNRVTFLTILAGLGSAEALADGRLVHEEIRHGQGVESDVVVATALVNMYGKCGSVGEARRVFKTMVKGRNVISWNAMISAYAQNAGCDKQALLLFHQMLLEGMLPSSATFASVLDACSNLAEVGFGRKLHECARECGFDSDHFVATAAVDMYGKCGEVREAERIFREMKKQDVVVWSALISAYSRRGGEAMKIFRRMQQSGVRAESVSFLSVLSACRHAGMVEEGCACFASIAEDHELEVTLEQSSCMVDLLARTGWLSQAEDLVTRTPGGGDVYMWTTLLDACKRHGDVERGKRAAEKMMKLDPKNSVAYVTLSQMFAAEGGES